MKRFIIITGLCLISEILNAQNLVPNSSFEDTVQCPELASQIDRAAGWSSYRISPDYYHSCDTTYPYFGVPNTFYGGFQWPLTGDAMIGMEVCATQLFFHEVAGVQLTQPLIVGQKYYCSMFVSRGNGLNNILNVAANKIGFKFTNQSFNYNNPIPIDNISQVHTNNVILDTIGWTKIDGCFIADSAYQFLSLGIFFQDNFITMIDYSNMDPSAGAYYFFDDIFVGIDTSQCTPNSSNEPLFLNVGISSFPNPFTDELILDSKLKETVMVELINEYGQVVIRQSVGNGYNKMLTSNISSGIYFLKINSLSSNSSFKLAKIKTQ